MAPLTFRTKRLSVTADVPAPVESGLRRLRLRWPSPDVAANGGLPVADQLLIAKRIPGLQLVRRSVADSVRYFEEILAETRPEQPVDPIDADAPSAPEELRRAVSSVWWYHTIELPGGVVTPGAYDHRRLVPEYGLPADLRGRTALDIATFDGFWAFELESRGADVTATDVARVTDIDLPPQVRDALVRNGTDWETGRNFELARRARKSSVRRIVRSVYDIDPHDVGTFDFVHVADLLLHLENPGAALRAVRGVTKGQALISDCFDPHLGPGLVKYEGGWRVATWSVPSLDTLAQMVLDAGFDDVKVQCVYRLGTSEAPKGPWRASLLATP